MIFRMSVITMILCKAMYCSKIHCPIPPKEKLHKLRFRTILSILINCLKQWRNKKQTNKPLNEQSSSFFLKIFFICEYGPSRKNKKYFRPQWRKVLVYCTEIYILKLSQFVFWKFSMDWAEKLSCNQWLRKLYIKIILFR